MVLFNFNVFELYNGIPYYFVMNLNLVRKYDCVLVVFNIATYYLCVNRMGMNLQCVGKIDFRNEMCLHS